MIMMLFIRAEREEDCCLHLETVRQMLPYFFAAGHVNYARYGLYYVRSMEALPPDIEKKVPERGTSHEAQTMSVERGLERYVY